MTIQQDPAASDRRAQRLRALARGRHTQQRARESAREHRRHERVQALRARRAELERAMPELEAAYDKALRHVRCDGLDEAGDRLQRAVAELSKISRELREMGA